MSLVDTYYDSAADVRVTRQRALQELVRHGIELETLSTAERDDFEGLFGTDRMCWAQQLLVWLGY